MSTTNYNNSESVRSLVYPQPYIKIIKLVIYNTGSDVSAIFKLAKNSNLMALFNRATYEY